MPFDLKGANPSEYSGEWIRFNVWTWHSIWRAALELFPDTVSSVKIWHSNSGEFVTEDTCIQLASQIERYSIEMFSKVAASQHVPNPQKDIGERTVEAGILFGMPAFILFLRSCNGFYIK